MVGKYTGVGVVVEEVGSEEEEEGNEKDTSEEVTPDVGRIDLY